MIKTVYGLPESCIYCFIEEGKNFTMMTSARVEKLVGYTSKNFCA
ncbi:hypothetical protein [Bartonella sp. CB169]